MMRLSIAQTLSVLLILAVGAIGIALVCNIVVHALNPSIVLIQTSDLTTISLFEILGICFSFALSKGRPPLGFLLKKKQAIH
jgi:hypothetical protein